jgi:serine/threonine-protein kinase RsbW/stage II sporulation protein AB (anti-sigma F factor)
MPEVVAEDFRRSARAVPASVTSLRQGVVSFARARGADDGVAQKLALAVGEGLNNVVMHAYVGIPTGRIHVHAWCDPKRHLLVQISDDGLGMLPRTDSPGLGLGVSIMAQAAEDVHLASRGDGPGTTLSLRFNLGH